MANINIQIPDELHKKLKLQAIESEITIKEQIIHALEERVKKK